MNYSLFDSLFDSVIVISKDRRIVYFNKSAKAILPELKVGMSCRGLFSLCNRCPMDFVMEEQEGVQIYDVEIKDSNVHVCHSMTPIYEGGKFVGVVEIFKDVSRVIYLMEEVRKQKEFVEVVLDSIVEAVLVLDTDGRVIDHNTIAKRMLCREGQSIKSIRVEELINLSLKDIEVGDRTDVYIETPCGKQKASLLLSKLKQGEGYVLSLYVVPEVSIYSSEEGSFVVKSRNLSHVLDTVRSIAEYNVNVLIEGETGTGKSLLAKYIHTLSPRRHEPFVKINCAAIPENLLEAELFGYVKGAFTGAVRDKPGKVEIAQGGTLFLDEISELPLHLQAKILHLVQDKEYERVGDIKTRKADVRIIAATNRDLKALVSEGKFREDLYYRLNVVRIEIPPLRERREDIPALVNHFIERFSSLHGKKIKGVSAEALEILMGYDYPGNVRELENIVERAVIVCRSSYIKKEDLPEDVRRKDDLPERAREKPEDEAQLIKEALKQAGGNKSLAAKMLGMHRTTLWRKIKEYGIE